MIVGVSAGLAAVPCVLLVLLLLCSEPRPATSCPAPCQCSSQYYAYCQDAGLADQDLGDVIAQVSRAAVLLDLSDNQLTRLPHNLLGMLQSLEILNLAANHIVQLGDDAFSGLTSLEELSLHRNKIENITTATFKGLLNLKELHLGDNRLAYVPSRTFKNLSSVLRLHLQKNSITQLPPTAFVGLTSLQALNISDNLLSFIPAFAFAGLEGLKKLDLSHNRIAEFSQDAFNGLVNLRELFLQRNNISDPIFMYGNDFYLSLSSLFLGENRITSLPSHVMPHNKNLKNIDLSSNLIRRIGGRSFADLHLDSLSLRLNDLIEINRNVFKGLSKISTLDLSGNKIAEIKTGAFDSFRDTVSTMDVRSNRLTSIHSGMFRGMSQLRTLSLGSNRVSVLDSDCFSDLGRLYELDLSSNAFHELRAERVAGPTQLKRLLLVCNPLQRLVGFVFDSVTDDVYIETNSTMTQATPTSAHITWPYKEGSHLYWTLTVMCLTSPGGCPVGGGGGGPTGPAQVSILKPYVTETTVTGLIPESQYFACVTPAFLSPGVHISQCVHVRTPAHYGALSPAQPGDEDESTGPLLDSTSRPLPVIWFLVLGVFVAAMAGRPWGQEAGKTQEATTKTCRIKSGRIFAVDAS